MMGDVVEEERRHRIARKTGRSRHFVGAWNAHRPGGIGALPDMAEFYEAHWTLSARMRALMVPRFFEPSGILR